jgi:UDP-N-acetylmuramate dehydrogenase
MEVKRGISVKNLSTMRVGGEADAFMVMDDPSMLPAQIEALKSEGKMILPLGEGSNTIFKDGLLPIAILKIENKGFEVLREDEDEVLVKVSSGENWDGVVERIVGMGLSGVEAMSAIPGTMGATPIQNVGAYGQEIADVFIELEGFDYGENVWKTLRGKDCGFSYRNSAFKEGKIRDFIITSVTVKLSKKSPQIPIYHRLLPYFEGRTEGEVNVREIREAVIEVRSKILPDPGVISNSGSFFANPIVSAECAVDLKEKFAEIKFFELSDGRAKLYAGWLLEACGLKGFASGNLGTYKNNALVVVNKGVATFTELEDFREMMVKKVKQKFGVTLEMEPNIVW